MKKQMDLSERNDLQQENMNSIKKPLLWSSCCPYRVDVAYIDDQPSLTRQEFTEECDVNVIMKHYEQTGVLPQKPGRDPIYWDAAAVPSNLQDAMTAMMYANDLFMQLGAPIRKEFDNDAVKFVNFASDPNNGAKLKEWGLTQPETAPSAPMRVEVVTPNPPAPTASSGPGPEK